MSGSPRKKDTVPTLMRHHWMCTEMRLKMGLSEEAATKIIKGVQNQRLIGNLQAAKSQGALTLEKVLDMADSGVDVDSFISADMRLQMFSKEVQLLEAELSLELK